MNRYEFDKYDTLGELKFLSRDVLRSLRSHKEYTVNYLAKLKKEEQPDVTSRFIISEKILISERCIEKINVGMDEIDVLLTLDLFCNIMDAEKVRTRLQVKRLVQENKWLKTELYDLQKRLIKLEESVVSAEAEKQHYQFVYKMRNQQRSEDVYDGYVISEEDEEDTDPEEEIPSKVKAVHNLCMDYIKEKRYEVAIPLCEEYIHQIKSKEGENNNDIATLYSIVGKVNKEQGNLAEAQKFYEECLKIREKVFGKDHNTVGITLTNLAKVVFKRNNPKEAERLANQALKIREKVLGKNTAEIALLHAHLGLYAMGLNKWNDVINHYKIAMTIYEQLYDITDSLMIKGYSNMAKAYVKLKQNDKAAEMLGTVCKSFQQKNTNITDLTSIFQVAQQHADGKITDLSPEFLLKKFGTCESVLDKDVLETMIEHFTNLKKTDTVDELRAWIESSNKQPNPVVRQSIAPRSSKKSSNAEKRTSESSKSSKKDKSSSIMGFFKKDKKK